MLKDFSPYRYKDLLAFQGKDGFLAFHSRNLEIASIDREAWNSLTENPELSRSEAANELIAWEQSNATETTNSEFTGPANVLQMNIAQICNLKCDYCAAGGDGTYGEKKEYKIDLTAAYRQVSHMINQLKDGNTFRIHFIGGEPLLYPKEIERIVSYTDLAVAGKNIKTKYSITTNGTLITESVARFLGKIKAAVAISIDGPDAINDQMRPAKRKDLSSTDLTRAGLKELSKVRDQLTKLSFHCVFGVHNTALVEAYHFLRAWNPDVIHFGFAATKGDKQASEAYSQQLTQVLSEAYEIGGRDELVKLEPFASMFSHLETQKRKINYCGAGKSMIHMDTKGGLYACNWFINRGEEKVGTAGKPDAEKLSAYSKSLIDLHDCRSCWARFLCGGGCMLYNYEKNDDKHVSDEEFCFRTRQMAMMAIGYFAKIHESA